MTVVFSLSSPSPLCFLFSCFLVFSFTQSLKMKGPFKREGQEKEKKKKTELDVDGLVRLTRNNIKYYWIMQNIQERWERKE